MLIYCRHQSVITQLITVELPCTEIVSPRFITNLQQLKTLQIKVTRINVAIYRVIQKDGLNFVRLYFLNYTWYVNDLHNI